MTTQEIVVMLADEAQKHGADGSDSNGAVKELVLDHGLGFNAWFSVCCELADRSARAQGFKDQFDRAARSMKVTLEPSGMVV